MAAFPSLLVFKVLPPCLYLDLSVSLALNSPFLTAYSLSHTALSITHDPYRAAGRPAAMEEDRERLYGYQ